MIQVTMVSASAKVLYIEYISMQWLIVYIMTVSTKETNTTHWVLLITGLN